MKKLNIGILGLGTVGGGTYDILVKNKDIIQKRTGVTIEVVKILDLRKRPGVDESLFTDDPDEVLNNPEVDLIVETLGGIQPASSFMLQAMKNGKPIKRL